MKDCMLALASAGRFYTVLRRTQGESDDCVYMDPIQICVWCRDIAAATTMFYIIISVRLQHGNLEVGPPDNDV